MTTDPIESFLGEKRNAVVAGVRRDGNVATIDGRHRSGDTSGCLAAKSVASWMDPSPT
jgi:hypothetical protein